MIAQSFPSKKTFYNQIQSLKANSSQAQQINSILSQLHQISQFQQNSNQFIKFNSQSNPQLHFSSSSFSHLKPQQINQNNTLNQNVEDKITALFQSFKNKIKNVSTQINIIDTLFYLVQAFKDCFISLKKDIDISPKKLLFQAQIMLVKFNQKIQQIRNHNHFFENIDIQPILQAHKLQRKQTKQNELHLQIQIPQQFHESSIKNMINQLISEKKSSNQNFIKKKLGNIVLEQQIQDATLKDNIHVRQPNSPRRLFGAYLSPGQSQDGSFWNETTAFVQSPRSMANLHELRETFKNRLKRTKICAKLNNRCKHYSKVSQQIQGINKKIVSIKR